MAASILHEVETAFVNSWAEDGAYDLAVNAEFSEQLRRLNLDLIDVQNFLRMGRVIVSDMVDARGLWDVRGTTHDGDAVHLKILVTAAECLVECLRIVEVKRRKR